jgi:hypothetical protein
VTVIQTTAGTQGGVSTDERVKRLLDSVVEEHGGLLASLRGLEALIEPRTPPPSGDVHRRVEALRKRFESHIDDEETSDLYAWLPAAYPSVKAEADRLKAEHEDLIRELREASDETSHAESVETLSIDLSSPLSVKLRSLIVRLRQHEVAETELIRKARG